MGKFKEKLSFEEKLQKDEPAFCSSVDGMGVEALNKELVRYAKYSEEIQSEIENSAALKEAKEALKLITGPFNDAKKGNRTKMRYIINLIKAKGGQ
jgi:hypothetical protein